MFGFGGGNQVNVRITGDASDLKRETATAQRDVDKFAGRTQRSFGTTASVIKGAMALGAGVAVANFAKDTIDAASNLQESNNAIQVMFGKSADAIGEIGERSADSFGMSQREFNDFAVRFSAFAKQIAERDGRSVVEIVDKMSGRVADFASVHNLSLERAAEVAQSTLAGETEVFRRFGGDVSAARVEAKLLEEGIVDSGEAISEQDKILGRYILFMEQTEDTAGDFKNTQDDLANATRTATANFEDFQAKIGEGVLPILADLVKAAEPVLDVLALLSDGYTDIKDAADETAKGAVDSGGVIEGVMGRLAAFATKPALPALLELITDAFEETTGATEDAGDAADDAGPKFSTIGGALAGIPDPADRSMKALGRLEVQTDGNVEAARNYIEALEDQHDRLRASVDPTFAAIQGAQDYREAQEKLNKAIKDEGPASDAAIEASEELSDAWGDMQGALDELVELGIDPASERARDMFKQMGVPESTIDAIIGRFEQMQSEMPILDLRVRAPGIHYTDTGGGNAIPRRGDPYVFHQGGTVPGLPGQEVMARLQAGETVLPTQYDNGDGMGANLTVIVQGFVGSELQLAQEIDRLLTRRSRSSGLDFNR